MSRINLSSESCLSSISTNLLQETGIKFITFMLEPLDPADVSLAFTEIGRPIR